MAILNVTPDSFGDAVRFVRDGSVDVESAVEAALRMEEAGADVIDVGGESTEPARNPPRPRRNQRVVPVIRALRAVRALLSIPTKPSCRAASTRAAIVNDISGLVRP